MQLVNCERSLPISKQNGITLIEVLVSILLMTIIGLGGAFIASRTAVIHRDQNIHLHAINEMRYRLESSGCLTDSNQDINVVGTTVAVDCNYIQQSYTVAAYASNGSGVASTNINEIKVNHPKLEVNSADTFVPVKVEISP